MQRPWKTAWSPRARVSMPVLLILCPRFANRNAGRPWGGFTTDLSAEMERTDPVRPPACQALCAGVRELAGRACESLARGLGGRRGPEVETWSESGARCALRVTGEADLPRQGKTEYSLEVEAGDSAKSGRTLRVSLAREGESLSCVFGEGDATRKLAAIAACWRAMLGQEETCTGGECGNGSGGSTVAKIANGTESPPSPEVGRGAAPLTAPGSNPVVFRPMARGYTHGTVSPDASQGPQVSHAPSAASARVDPIPRQEGHFASPGGAAVGVGDKGPAGALQRGTNPGFGGGLAGGAGGTLRQEDGMLVGKDHPIFSSGPQRAPGLPEGILPGQYDFVDPELPQGRPRGARWDDPRPNILPGDLGPGGPAPKRDAGSRMRNQFFYY